jgi:hypothetical protein
MRWDGRGHRGLFGAIRGRLTRDRALRTLDTGAATRAPLPILNDTLI